MRQQYTRVIGIVVVGPRRDDLHVRRRQQAAARSRPPGWRAVVLKPKPNPDGTPVTSEIL
ncbi:MAG: hypothetical protein R2695_09350 [Acidimicrobiales bacterium]